MSSEESAKNQPGSAKFSLAPLRKKTSTSAPYTRPREIEAKLIEMAGLPQHEVLRRCEVTDKCDPDYIPSECVLHLVRACRGQGQSEYFCRLYELVAARVLHRLPKPKTSEKTESLALRNLRDDAFGRFTEMLAEDYRGYSEKLDYYEVRFDSAVKMLRLDSSRKVGREAKGEVPLEIDPDSGEISGKAEKGGGSFDPFNPEKLRLEDYRSRLDAAIDALAPVQRRIIEMIRQEIPISSQDPQAITIAKALGKSEKTIRTYRDQAFAFIRNFCGSGEAL